MHVDLVMMYLKMCVSFLEWYLELCCFVIKSPKWFRYFRPILSKGNRWVIFGYLKTLVNYTVPMKIIIHKEETQKELNLVLFIYPVCIILIDAFITLPLRWKHKQLWYWWNESTVIWIHLYTFILRSVNIIKR